MPPQLPELSALPFATTVGPRMQSSSVSKGDVPTTVPTISPCGSRTPRLTVDQRIVPVVLG